MCCICTSPLKHHYLFSEVVAMNLDKVRLKVSLVDPGSGEVVHPRMPRRQSVHDVAYVVSYGQDHYVEGSPLTWFYGQNLCGPDVYPLLERWADEVTLTLGFRSFVHDITAAEIFGLYRAWSIEAALGTEHWYSVTAKIRYGRKAVDLTEGVVDSTFYSRPIRDYKGRGYLHRVYAKLLQILAREPGSSLAFLDADDVVKYEVSAGSGALNAYRRRLPEAERMRRLTMDDFEKIYWQELNKIIINDPCSPIDQRPLTAKQKVICNAMLRGEDVSHHDRRTLKMIRERTGCRTDLKHSLIMDRIDTPHIPIEELRDPNKEVEKELWGKAMELGLFDELS